MSYSKDVLDGLKAVTQAAQGLKDDSVDSLVSTMVINLQQANWKKKLELIETLQTLNFKYYLI